VPDFAFEGEGVKIGSVMPGSAGEKAGLLAGDIIIKLDNDATPDLRTYSDLLKKHQPNDVIMLTVLRNGKSKVVKLTLGER
jgi:S1-C subfamily serine protease